MKISQVMTHEVETISPSASLVEAAEKMERIDCGFLPIASNHNEKLQGVITDRDIVIRAISKGLDPAETKVEQIKSKRVLYCYEEDDIERAAESMYEQQVYRLLVLDNPQNKKMRGVVSLGDIARCGHPAKREATGYATEGMKASHH